ncbi:MAG: ribonuclease J, partial [Ilumatobacter sp.]|nr:ribonuclease J [Ilumatobacter sp.]
FTYLREHADAVVGLVATHGHEDHVGGIQFLLRDDAGIGGLRDEPLPIYGARLTLGLARNRIEEAGLLGRCDMRPVTDNARIDVGPFEVEFIPVTHSVPHAHAIAVHTTQGVVLHTGDWKLDLTPVDRRRTDLARIGQLTAGRGIRLLMGDSTNAEEAGYAPSETSVGGVLAGLFAEHRDRRIITASFASHLHRIQQIADAAIGAGRKVATLGLSMKKNVRLGIDLGVITIPDSALIDIEDIDQYEPGQICVISTGSQGEPMSALSLLARGENKFVKLGEHDTVILSSHAIPGNESAVNRVIDGLLKRGAEVIHSGVHDVHATGHAQADEIKTYLSLAKPEWYVPIHGEYRHMMANARLGELMGIPRTNVVMCEDGDVIELSDDGLVHAGRVPSGYVYVDGIIGDVGHGVIRDRRVLGEEGVVVVVVTVDIQTGKVLTGPDIITRGWVYAPEAEDLLDEACDRVADAVEAALEKGERDVEALERDVRRAAGKFVNERTRRRPMIVPVVMET